MYIINARTALPERSRRVALNKKRSNVAPEKRGGEQLGLFWALSLTLCGHVLGNPTPSPHPARQPKPSSVCHWWDCCSFFITNTTLSWELQVAVRDVVGKFNQALLAQHRLPDVGRLGVPGGVSVRGLWRMSHRRSLLINPRSGLAISAMRCSMLGMVGGITSVFAGRSLCQVRYVRRAKGDLGFPSLLGR